MGREHQGRAEFHQLRRKHIHLIVAWCLLAGAAQAQIRPPAGVPAAGGATATAVPSGIPAAAPLPTVPTATTPAAVTTPPTAAVPGAATAVPRVANVVPPPAVPTTPPTTPGGVQQPAAGGIRPPGVPATPTTPTTTPTTPIAPAGLVTPPGSNGIATPGGGGSSGMVPTAGPGLVPAGPGIGVGGVPGSTTPSPLTPAGAIGISGFSSPAPGVTPAATTGAVGQDSIPATISTVSINQAGTTVTSAYRWTVSKRFNNQAQTLALSIPATTGTAVANYELSVTKSLATQTVTVAGTISIAGNSAFTTPTLSYSPAPATTPTGSVSCIPPNQAPATCTFTQSWPDTSIAAAAGGVVTASIGSSTGTAAYSFTGTTGGTTGNCATITDNFSAGQLTGTNMQMTGNAPPAGMQLCDIGTKLFTYAVSFQNMANTWCSTPLTASNTATATPTDGGAAASDTASVTIQVTGCTGTATATSGSLSGAAVSVSGIKTTVVNTYTWTLEQTGGGSSLTTTPSEELTIPYTTTATQTLTSAAGYVAGTISMQNTLSGTISITSVAVDVGSGGSQTLALSSCTTTQVAAGASTSCSFNVTAPNAPAAGSVTATVGYTPSGGEAATQSSTATSYTFTTADTYNLGGSATLYLAIDASSLNSIPGLSTNNQAYTTAINPTTGQPYTTTNTNNWANYVRVSPADAAPPTTPPGITITGSATYTYNIIVSKMYTCMDQRTLTNTATLTPTGSSQTALTRATPATLSVTGCNVLPTVALSNIQTFAAVTWTWALTKSAQPSSYQIPVGSAATAQYSVQLTRTRSTGNYAMAGTLTITNPATFPMYISSVTLMSTSGSFGALPPACLGGSNVAGSTISGMTGPGYGQFGGPLGTSGSWGNTGSFSIAAGAQIQCQFNITAGTGAAPQGQVYAQATTTSSYVTSTGNTAISQNVPIDFTAPTQQWDIGGCVTFADRAVTQGAAGAWAPQMSDLPQQQRICDSRSFPYAGAISPVPETGALCNQPVTITNTATALPDGGGATAATATATIQVIATGCAASTTAPATQQQVVPSPAIATQTAQQLSSNPLVPAVQPSVKVVGVGGYEWATSITSTADAKGSVSVPYAGTSSVVYTVVARRKPAFTYYVSGVIVVQNTNAQAVSATSVSAQLTSGYVMAACPGGRFPISIPAQGTISCAFNATLVDASGAQGSVLGVATSTFGSATSQSAVAYSFDSSALGSKPPGACAILSDSLTSKPVLGQNSVVLTDNRPYSADAKPLCTDGQYNFTAAFGPFSETSCNKYQVVAEAAATPTDSSQSGPATSRNTLQLYVEGCPATAQSLDTVLVTVAPPFGRSTPSVRWAAQTSSDWSTTLKYTDNGTITFNVNLTRVDSETSRLSGSLTVTNPTSAPISLKSAIVLADFSSGSQAGGAANGAPSSSIDAQCKDTTLAPRASVNCSYTGTVSGGGSGSLTAEVMLGSGRIVSSNPVRFDLPGRTVKSGSTATESSGTTDCADIVTGLFLSPALMLPNRTAPTSNVQQIKACNGGSQQVAVAVGPWGEEACGVYTVVLTTRVRPAATTGQVPFSSLGVAKLDVTGCPLKETPVPDPTIADQGMNVSNVVQYPWRVVATTNTDSVSTDPLRVPVGSTKDVVVDVQVIRDPGQRSVGIQGFVQVTARGTKSVKVSSVQVAVLKRLGELQVVDANCPPASAAPSSDKTAAGATTAAASTASSTAVDITVPARPAKLLCSFRVADLPPMDGAITPLVYETPDSPSPLPAMPALYRVASGTAVRLGECAVLGASRSLKPVGSEFAVEGQPSSKASTALPAQPVCGSYSTQFGNTFGRFTSQQCGQYTFTGSFSAKPFNTSRTSTAATQFTVDVTGCPAAQQGSSSSSSSSRQQPGAAASGSAGRSSSSRGSRTQRMSTTDAEMLADMLGESANFAFGQ